MFAQCKPLLLPGKKTLFQRVITHPGAALHASPSPADRMAKGTLATFSVLYVYERSTVDGRTWLKVGYSTNCEPVGWIKANEASDWRQSLTLIFRERTGRQPVLFFKSLDDLENVAGSSDPAGQTAQLVTDFHTFQKEQTQPS